MSATSTTPTTTTTSSTPSPSSSGINIPTTTVVAIGFGFVSFALGVFCLLLSIRAIKLYRQARASRWTDQPRTFRQVWRENGGVFGFFHGFNNAGNSIALGGGGRGLGMYGGVGIGLGMDEITRARLWNELGVYWDHDNRRWARVLHPGEGFVLGGGGEEGGVDGGKKPEMWEVAVGGAGRGGGTDEKSLLNAGPEEMRGMKNYIVGKNIFPRFGVIIPLSTFHITILLFDSWSSGEESIRSQPATISTHQPHPLIRSRTAQYPTGAAYIPTYRPTFATTPAPNYLWNIAHLYQISY